MSKVLTVISREYLERVRSKSFLIGTLLGPALMSMFIVIPLLTAGNGGKDQRTIAVIDQSGDVRGPLAAVLAEEAETVEDVYEPFLLRLGFLDRTPQGRIATDAARSHLASLGYEIPSPRRAEPDLQALWEDLGPRSG